MIEDKEGNEVEGFTVDHRPWLLFLGLLSLLGLGILVYS